MAVNQHRAPVAVNIAWVEVGGNHPIVIQSMTNTDTADVMSTVNLVMAWPAPDPNWCASRSSAISTPTATCC